LPATHERREASWTLPALWRFAGDHWACSLHGRASAWNRAIDAAIFPAHTSPHGKKGRCETKRGGSARCADRTSQRDIPAKPQKPSALPDTRVIYCGDNLERPGGLPGACVDLICIDPPFKSDASYGSFDQH
jgi:hypothetical protein